LASDIIRLKNLTFHAYHGVWDEEKEIGQRFEVDIELKVDNARAASTDKLKDTIDLYQVFQTVENVMMGNKYNLVETMAENIATNILEKYHPGEVLVRIRKPHAPIRGLQDGIEVEIVRKV